MRERPVEGPPAVHAMVDGHQDVASMVTHGARLMVQLLSLSEAKRSPTFVLHQQLCSTCLQMLASKMRCTINSKESA
jgi:hypothetical protein